MNPFSDPLKNSLTGRIGVFIHTLEESRKTKKALFWLLLGSKWLSQKARVKMTLFGSLEKTPWDQKDHFVKYGSSTWAFCFIFLRSWIPLRNQQTSHLSERSKLDSSRLVKVNELSTSHYMVNHLAVVCVQQRCKTIFTSGFELTSCFALLAQEELLIFLGF